MPYIPPASAGTPTASTGSSDPTGNSNPYGTSSNTGGLGGLLGGLLEGDTPAGQYLKNQGYNSQADLSNENQVYNQQMMLAQLQQSAAQGQGPSAAQAQLQSGVQQGIQAQLGSAAGSRYGQTPAQASYQAAGRGAAMQGNAANQATQLRAQEMQNAQSGLGNTLGQAQQGALGMSQATQAAQAPVATLAGAEQQQQAGLGAAAFQGMMNAAGGAASMGIMARGGVYLGEKGPEVDLPPRGRDAKLIDHPMLTHLAKGHTVLPLRKGSAPYRGGPLPVHETKGPSRKAPRHIALHPAALAEMHGRRAPAPKQPGIAPLSPRTAPAVKSALDRAGLRAGGVNAEMAHGGMTHGEPPHQLEILIANLRRMQGKGKK